VKPLLRERIPGQHSSIINHGGASWHATFTATVRNAMSYTLTTAARAVGLNRTTILRAIKSGKISGAKDEHGEWHIEPCELHRVYPPVSRTEERSDATPQYAPAEDVELRIRATLAEARLADLKATLDDMRSQRDNWQTVAQRLAITDQRPTQLPSQSSRPWRWRLIDIWMPLAGGGSTART
jgi:hypothetical protein